MSPVGLGNGKLIFYLVLSQKTSLFKFNSASSPFPRFEDFSGESFWRVNFLRRITVNPSYLKGDARARLIATTSARFRCPSEASSQTISQFFSYKICFYVVRSYVVLYTNYEAFFIIHIFRSYIKVLKGVKSFSYNFHHAGFHIMNFDRYLFLYYLRGSQRRDHETLKKCLNVTRSRF